MLEASREGDLEGGGQISGDLEALTHPVRIRLLSILRKPRALSEIEVRKPEGERERPLARQTVRRHLDKLIEAGVVVSREAQRTYGPTTEYLVNHRRLFALSGEIRKLARLRPADEPEEETADADRSLFTTDPEAPHLVLVKGVDEGRVFELDGDQNRWILGRRRDADIPLEYDPYVSAENSLIRRDGSALVLSDLAESRNGTIVNGARLGPEEPRRLRAGDIIQVGDSTLIFRT